GGSVHITFDAANRLRITKCVLALGCACKVQTMVSAVFTTLKGVARRSGLKRHLVAKARITVERYALASMPRTQKTKHGRVLCYHSIGIRHYGVNEASPEQFRRKSDYGICYAQTEETRPTGTVARTSEAALDRDRI